MIHSLRRMKKPPVPPPSHSQLPKRLPVAKTGEQLLPWAPAASWVKTRRHLGTLWGLAGEAGGKNYRCQPLTHCQSYGNGHQELAVHHHGNQGCWRALGWCTCPHRLKGMFHTWLALAMNPAKHFMWNAHQMFINQRGCFMHDWSGNVIHVTCKVFYIKCLIRPNESGSNQTANILHSRTQQQILQHISCKITYW